MMLQRIRAFFSAYRLPILSGILIGTSYIPFPPWAVFFCFVPLWWFWLQQKTFKKVLLGGWITQFLLTLIGFNWVAHTVHEFGHLPLPVAFIVLLLFCSFANLHVVLAGALWWGLKRAFRLPSHIALWLLAPATALGELIYPMIFDWHFGYTWLWTGLPVYHLADIWGFQGLSALGIFFNVLVLRAVQIRTRAAWLRVAAGVLVFVGLNLWGWQHARQLPEPDAEATVLVVQANIGNLEKQYAEQGWGFREHIIDRYLKITEQGLQPQAGQPTFAVWPETAFPDVLGKRELTRGRPARLAQFLREHNLALITGGYGRHEDTGQTTNSLFTLNDQGQLADTPYHKTVLLAFGEYFPGANLFPKIKELFPQVADFGRGAGPAVKSLDGLTLGAQICYEGLFDWFTRDLANLGSQIIINVTNDSWYGKWQQPYQHLYMTLARAIEVRRPLVRSTNTGISTVVLADGTILEQSPLHQEWQHLYRIPYRRQPSQTVFQTWGYWLTPMSIALWILVVLACGLLRPHTPRD